MAAFNLTNRLFFSNYCSEKLPQLCINILVEVIVIGKCTIWRQKLLFISYLEIYQHHAHLLWDGIGGGEGRPLSEMAT
jgi:hypothetical protein